MLVNYRSPEGIEAQCEGVCPAHRKSSRPGRRRAKQALKQSIKRREDRTWRRDQERQG